ncbi:MAG: nuclear transport factor 2 family protein [Gemmatimonadota bacterium]
MKPISSTRLLGAALLWAAAGACGPGGSSDPAADGSPDLDAGAEEVGATPGDHAAVTAAVDRFHAALEAGDSITALELLLPNATILEAGGIESREEYRSHHLQADIDYAAAVRPERAVRQVMIEGDTGWAISESLARGEVDGRPISSQGAELIILNRTDDGWRIAAIHWSSRRLGG